MLVAQKAAEVDWSKSLSGTAEDSRREREDAAMLRGADKEAEEDPLAPLLLAGTAEREEVLALGRWLKYLGAAGCYLYIHSLTRDEVSIRPAAFVEEETAAVVEEDPYAGVPTCELQDIIAEIERIVTVEKKTPLVIDRSEDRKLATFFKFKGVLIDATQLALPLRDKARPRAKEFMEVLRARAVQAMRNGATLALDLGDCDGSKAPIHSQWCRNEGFRKEIFIEGGKGLIRNKLAYKKMYLEGDREHGECVVRDGFSFVVITKLSPQEYAKEIDDGIPLEKCFPIVCLSTSA